MSDVWWQNATVYQLYVRSFADANGDGVGDIAGLHSRLDYLSDLGVDAVWLNPCYASPQRDHGYDIADYFRPDPAYGELADLAEFIDAAHAAGIRVLMDMVANHCSTEHAWFRDAVSSGRGSAPSGPRPSRKRNRARSGLPGAEARAAMNHGGWSEQWFATMSMTTRMPWRCASSTSSSNSARSPYAGSMAR